MNCKMVREMILTDYGDNQMDDINKAAIEKHLSECPGCKEFSIMAGKATAELFNNVCKASPPEYVWRRIEENIIANRHEKRNSATNYINVIRNVFRIPKPALAFSMMLIIIITIGTVMQLVFYKQGIMESDNPEGIEYFNGLAGGSSGNNSKGFETVIEEYFL